ncbi:MAG: hypothetical protein WCE79_13225 [Xanthobacteraceae bacterium]
MSTSPKSADRLSVLESVKSPLGFFTLCILVIELILGGIAVRATDQNLTILIAGMLGGFAMLCLMVFRLAVHPKAGVLLGRVEEHPAVQLRNMSLTQNDVRVLYASLMGHGSLRTGNKAALGDAMSLEHRVKKLQGHNFAVEVKSAHAENGIDYRLTSEGVAVGELVRLFYESIRELKDHDKMKV